MEQFMSRDDMLALAKRAQIDPGAVSEDEIAAMARWLLEHQEPWSDAHYSEPQHFGDEASSD